MSSVVNLLTYGLVLLVKILILSFSFVTGMPKMKKLLMIKKKLDGSTSMEMFSGSLNTNLCLLQLLEVEHSYSFCKDCSK